MVHGFELSLFIMDCLQAVSTQGQTIASIPADNGHFTPLIFQLLILRGLCNVKHNFRENFEQKEMHDKYSTFNAKHIEGHNTSGMLAGHSASQHKQTTI